MVLTSPAGLEAPRPGHFLWSTLLIGPCIVVVVSPGLAGL